MRPSLSLDGRQVAYVWQQGNIISVLGFWSTSVVVAPASQPDARTLRWPIVWTAPNGRIADAVSALSWADDHTLRFLIAYEFIFKVKGGGPLHGHANCADLPVAITAASDSSVAWLVPGDSVPHELRVGSGVGPVMDIAPVPGTRRFVAVVERGRDLFGDPANLWLYELP